MKQRVCIILAAWLIAAFAGLLLPDVQAGDVPRITVQELNKKLCAPDVILLDVRVAGSWGTSNQKIKCAQRVDPDTVASWSGTLPKNKEIVIYCS
jgi:rhodanese-related sulfurtransferase